jgi:septum formation protein
LQGNNYHLVLASASPRRKELLSAIGLRFITEPSDIVEDEIPGESPENMVSRLARLKAAEISVARPRSWILGADTIVVINGRILGKPEDVDDACRMLGLLAGRIHTVFTGYAIINSEFPDREKINYVKSDVLIRPLSSDEIKDYVCTGEPMDKAGSYAIQGLGSGIVQKVEGSYTNVVGLPVCEVAMDLKDMGIFDFLKAGHGNDCG